MPEAMTDLSLIAANAITPDQLLPYVSAVSGLETIAVNSCALHYGNGFGVLIAYPWQDPLDQLTANEAIRQALDRPCIKHLTVIGPERPACAPESASSLRDAYWFLDLPCVQSAKVANMLRRARQEVDVIREGWQPEHAQLIQDFCRQRELSDNTRFLFGELEKYVSACPGAQIFSARRGDGSLAAFAIADFTAITTAFYMFAFRAQAAPPGASDLVLAAILAEAQARGYSRLNLGLGINGGIGFFKQKWGARPAIAFVETAWRPRKGSWLRRLFAW